MGRYSPRVELALRLSGWDFHTVGGGIEPGSIVFVPGLLELWMYGRICDWGMRSCPLRVALALQSRGWRVEISLTAVGLGLPHHALWYLPGEPFFSPVWSCRFMEGFLTGACDLILLGSAGSTYPSQLAMSQCDWGFHTVPGGIDPGDRRFHPRFLGVGDE